MAENVRELSQLEVDQWRDKKRHLWLIGLIAPTALAGVRLDRPVPALRPVARTRPAVRPGRAEPARGDGAARERQVLPLLHLDPQLSILSCGYVRREVRSSAGRPQ